LHFSNLQIKIDNHTWRTFQICATWKWTSFKERFTNVNCFIISYKCNLTFFLKNILGFCYFFISLIINICLKDNQFLWPFCKHFYRSYFGTLIIINFYNLWKWNCYWHWTILPNFYIVIRKSKLRQLLSFKIKIIQKKKLQHVYKRDFFIDKYYVCLVVIMYLFSIGVYMSKYESILRFWYGIWLRIIIWY
jgi:hypothetical protein